MPAYYWQAMYDRQPPLNDRELRIVRGMIDEYDYRQRQRRHWGTLFGDFRVIVGVLGAGMLIVMQGVELWLIASGRR